MTDSELMGLALFAWLAYADGILAHNRRIDPYLTRHACNIDEAVIVEE